MLEDKQVEKAHHSDNLMKKFLIILLLFVTLIGIFGNSFDCTNLSNIEKQISNKYSNEKENIKRILSVSDTQINTWTNNDQINQKISSLSDGNFVVVWQSYLEDGNGWSIYGQTFYSNGAKKGNEFPISNSTILNSTNPNVASSSSGKFMVVWQQGDGNIFGQIFINDGTKLNDRFQINTHQIYGTLSIIILTNDNFVVSWDYSSQIFNQILTNNGVKVGSQNNFTQQGEYISTASLANGNFVMSYSNQSIYAIICYSNGTMLKSEFIVNTHINQHDISSISSLSTSNFMIVWESIGQDIIGSNDYGVYGQSFTSFGAKIGNEFRVNLYIIGDQAYPSIGSLVNDNYIVTWQSKNQDGYENGVYGQILDSTGDKIGSEFKINTYTISNQQNPSVSSLINNNFVVVWESNNNQDGSGYGIFGNIYQSNGLIIGFDTCPHNCQLCTNSTNCLICNPNFKLEVSGLCGCFDGFYLDNISDYICISNLSN